MLGLLAGTWHGTPNSLKASILSGMALFVKTYGLELSDRTFIRSMSAVGPDQILRQGRIDNNAALRYARIIWENYNEQQARGLLLPYCFKCGKFTVRARFANNGVSLEDCLKQVLI